MDNIRSKIFKIFLLFFVLMFVVSLFLEINLYFIASGTLKEQMGNKCLGIAISVATLLEQDTDSFKAYLETLDTESDYYLSTKANIEKIRFGNADNITFLYVEKQVSSADMMYVLDGELAGTDTFSPPGSVEPLTTTRKLCYDSGKPVVGGFVTTLWDTLLSAYAPVVDKDTGELLAIVGTDVSIKEYNRVMNNQLLVIVINAFVFALCAGIVLLLSSKGIEKKLFIDSLTGMYNRGFFISFLKSQLKMIKQKKYPVIVFIADIDHFKHVNDTYGHPFGDKVLANVSGVMNSCMRKSDCLARYGGEEFAGIMPGLSMEKSHDVIRRIHDAVGSTITADEDGTQVRVTISIGVAQLDKLESIDNVIKNADVALYEAKKTRDAVIYYPDIAAHDLTGPKLSVP